MEGKGDQGPVDQGSRKAVYRGNRSKAVFVMLDLRDVLGLFEKSGSE